MGNITEKGELTCYDGLENENNETKQCRADVTVNQGGNNCGGQVRSAGNGVSRQPGDRNEKKGDTVRVTEDPSPFSCCIMLLVILM